MEGVVVVNDKSPLRKPSFQAFLSIGLTICMYLATMSSKILLMSRRDVFLDDDGLPPRRKILFQRSYSILSDR